MSVDFLVFCGKFLKTTFFKNDLIKITKDFFAIHLKIKGNLKLQSKEEILKKILNDNFKIIFFLISKIHKIIRKH